MLGANKLPLRQGFRCKAKTLVRRTRGGPVWPASFLSTKHNSEIPTTATVPFCGGTRAVVGIFSLIQIK